MMDIYIHEKAPHHSNNLFIRAGSDAASPTPLCDLLPDWDQIAGL